MVADTGTSTGSISEGRGVGSADDELALPNFPETAPTQLALVLPYAARRQGVLLRPAGRADLPFLRALFGDLRRPELAAAGWPEDLRRAFCDNQFALQHRSFVAHFPGAEFFLVLLHGAPVGRLYVDRTGPVIHLVEIALLTTARRQGIGGWLLDSLKAAVRRSAAEALTLQVDSRNLAARRLYERAGFQSVGENGGRLQMRWER